MATARECQTTPAFDCLYVDSHSHVEVECSGEKIIQAFTVFVRLVQTSHFSIAAHKNQNEANISISHRKLSGKICERAKKDSFRIISKAIALLHCSPVSVFSLFNYILISEKRNYGERMRKKTRIYCMISDGATERTENLLLAKSALYFRRTQDDCAHIGNTECCKISVLCTCILLRSAFRTFSGRFSYGSLRKSTATANE